MSGLVESASAKRERRWLVKLLLAATSAVLALLVAEWGIRKLPIGDKLGWNRVAPVRERLQSVGPIAEGELRVLGLGDSFAEFRDSDGQNFMRFLESGARDAGLNVVLHNLGEGGTGLARYQENFDQYVQRAVPELVVIAVYLGNDLLDYELELRRAERGIVEPEKTQAKSAGFRQSLRKQSVLANHLFRLAKRRFSSLRSGTYRRNLTRLAELFDYDAQTLAKLESRIDDDMIERAEADAINAWDLAFGVAYPDMYADMLSLSADSHFAQAFEGFRDDLHRLGEKAYAKGSVPLFVLLPASIQVNERYQDFYRRLGHTASLELLGKTELNRATTEALLGRGWDVLDLTQSLMEREEVLYIPDDIHFNVRGQKVAGDAILSYCEVSGLFSPDVLQGRLDANSAESPLFADSQVDLDANRSDPLLSRQNPANARTVRAD